MTTYATTQTATKPVDSIETQTDNDDDNPEIGFQLCEFCKPKGVPHDNPKSVCECSSISRLVSGPYYVEHDFDTVIRIAETALIEHWSPSWNRPNEDIITIERSVVPGQCNDEYSVHIEFDGQVCNNISETFNTEDGEARIKGFYSDGKLHVGVTLHDASETCES